MRVAILRPGRVVNNDTLQTTMASKYHYGLWRPVTAIHRADEDGNSATAADVNWTPLHPGTPPYPTYAGNAASVGATFAKVLSDYFGSDDVSFDVHWPDTVGGTRSYTSFSQAAQETADSRIWGGIHFRFDSIAGQSVGNQVADYVLENFFQPVTPPRVPGDSNGDGQFDSADLALVFQAGKYEDGIPNNATFEEGDWNGDGDFDSGDLVDAFQAGNYVRAASPATQELSSLIDLLLAQDKDLRRNSTFEWPSAKDSSGD